MSGLPVHIREIEAIARPKEVLHAAVRAAQANLPARRRTKPEELHEPLAQILDLDYLAGLPAYQSFAQELESALRTSGILS